MRIGDRIRLLREKNGNTQSDVCASLGIEQSTLANYERNRRIPRADMIVAFADFFHVSTDYLLGRSDSPYIKNGVDDDDINQFLLQSRIVFDGEAINVSDTDRELLHHMLQIAFQAIKYQKECIPDGDKESY